ncbi:Cysteine and histidine-rich domain-containing protein 1-like [Oopsacas minuta]|uniref:Cysteine and histidine-rich domain-containing protein 1-like n=1 Tax=Oopsacas minuta TaxID=111878 RepID=A0AAV7JXJ0_9METZ|nr:Cysteine and histidine-rich domain-containing protein 1-like [Oopsacas minuta]
MSLLTCYNRGCVQKKFIESENNSLSCQYHPGVPIFHEGMKGWSCCKKRTTSFTDFLEFPGCEKGLHNPVKQSPPEKQVPDQTPDILPISQSESRVSIPGPAPRPTSPTVLIPLTAKVDESLVTQLKISKKSKAEPSSEEEQIQSCQNGGCKVLKKDGISDDTNCVYHSGTVVFHEGLKFWSCCQRKTTDFEEFLKQQGCIMGTHKWVWGRKPVSSSQIRFDHFQRGRNLVITFYGKLCDYVVCTVNANSTNLQISLLFEGGNKSFERLFNLYSTIIPEKSTVQYLKTKVEVCLVKDDQVHWPLLEFPVEDTVQTAEKETI